MNGSGHVSSGNPCRPSIQGSDSLPPPIVDMAQTTFSPHPSDLTPQPALPALIESIPVAMMSADVSRAPGLVLENVPVQASGSIRVQPKATPRVWGKVESAPVVLDDTLPSLADAVAASHKGKRGARR